ncbi:YggT family protein [Geitlerinema sp. PCC 7407]|uniref:YggT family protein n=1 Tax=Geitlerinema sp. PCC 7407 TaxID=1173025 RepID=UPI00029F83C8|nr:YggT family protein [Geitlerinema sp. PCC 7407]AFY67184.1 hypothetical protein GEI7407_2711 [Geitlerinema sp. PCC 7407]
MEEDRRPYEEPYEDPERQREELRLREEEWRMSVAFREARVNRAVSVIYYTVGALLILLLLRFLLRLFGANPENTFAQVIYGLSEPFAAPFSTLFISPASSSGPIFDVNLLVAMPVYALLAWLVGQLVRLIWSKSA